LRQIDMVGFQHVVPFHFYRKYTRPLVEAQGKLTIARPAAAATTSLQAAEAQGYFGPESKRIRCRTPRATRFKCRTRTVKNVPIPRMRRAEKHMPHPDVCAERTCNSETVLLQHDVKTYSSGIYADLQE